jgi:hypothetical protein
LKSARALLEYYEQRHVNSPCAAILELRFGASYLHLRAMSTRFHFVPRRIAGLLNVAACVVSVLMLLAFPMQRGHQFAAHFRSPEVRRSIERHTPIAHPEAGTAERIAHQAVLPALLVYVDTGDVVEPAANIEFASQVPLARLLLRLKLGPSRSGGQDPLL